MIRFRVQPGHRCSLSERNENKEGGRSGRAPAWETSEPSQMSMNRSIEFVKINKSTSVARSPETSAHPGERAVKNGLVDLTFKQKFGRSDWGPGQTGGPGTSEPSQDVQGKQGRNQFSEWEVWKCDSGPRRRLHDGGFRKEFLQVSASRVDRRRCLVSRLTPAVKLVKAGSRIDSGSVRCAADQYVN